MNIKDMVEQELKDHKETIDKCIEFIQDEILLASKLAVDTISNGNKIILFGNGGSAADAQHISAELVGRYKVDRGGLPAIALTTDTSIITSISNDYGYSKVFERQVEALAQKGDLIIGISTSGNSKNVINGITKGRSIGCNTVALTGCGGGELMDLSDINIVIPSSDTPRIQEMHILIGHIICQAIDDSF